MATTVVGNSESCKTSIRISRKASIVSSLSADGGDFHVKSGSFDLGQVKDGSVYIVSVRDGFVNPSFVDGSGDENVSHDCGFHRTDRLSDFQQGKNEKVGNISVMVIGPLEEPMTGWPFNTQRTESCEAKSESVSAGQSGQDKIRIPSDKDKPFDASKISDTTKLSIRDYLMAVSLFLITLITYGNAGSLSVLTVEWLKIFPNSKSLILFVPNLNYALMSGIGIIDAMLINRYGIYNIMILGCFLQTICVFCSSFSSNAITLVIVLGFLLGMATCFSYLNSFILMGIQFGNAGKSFIVALTLAGPLSGLVFSNLINLFVEQYAWRGSMFMLAAINLQMIPLSFFLLLSHKKKKKQLKITTSKQPAEQTPLTAPKKCFYASVFKDPLYVVYTCAIFFTICGINMMYSFLPSFLHRKGLNEKNVAELYSLYCIVAAVPRIFFGMIQQCIKFSYIHIFIGSVSIFALILLLINLANSYTELFVSCIFLSLSMGGPAGFYIVGILECLGPEKYSFGASITETSYGIGTGVLGYLASLLVEYMGSYEQSFCIYGVLIMTSNFCLLITTLVQYRREIPNQPNMAIFEEEKFQFIGTLDICLDLPCLFNIASKGYKTKKKPDVAINCFRSVTCI